MFRPDIRGFANGSEFRHHSQPHAFLRRWQWGAEVNLAEAEPQPEGGFPQHASKGRAGGAFQHAKAAGELYYQVISATWKETFQRIIVSLAVVYSPDDIEQMEKEIDDAKPEDYAILYSELFAKYETKRIELQDVTKPENDTGKK